MECSQCSRIWHAGGHECPTCGSPSLESLREADLASEASDPNAKSSGPPQIGFSRREFLIGAVAGGAAASVAILVPVGLTEWTGDGDPPADGNGPPVDGGDPPAVAIATFQRYRIAALSDLIPGEPFDFEYPLKGQSIFAVKLGARAGGGVGDDGDIVAYSYSCTHMGCPLVGLYKDEHKILGPCGCHFTTFDLTRHGVVVLGQATQNLPQITLDIADGHLYATGVMGLIYGYRGTLLDGEPVEATA